MVSFDEIVTVQICAKCGRGFTPWSEYLSTGIDHQPIWATKTVYESDFCDGRIVHVERRTQIERVEDEEFMRGEQWTPEQADQIKRSRDGKTAEPTD